MKRIEFVVDIPENNISTGDKATITESFGNTYFFIPDSNPKLELFCNSNHFKVVGFTSPLYVEPHYLVVLASPDEETLIKGWIENEQTARIIGKAVKKEQDEEVLIMKMNSTGNLSVIAEV